MSSDKKLDEKEIKEKLAELPGWELLEGPLRISKEYSFENFVDAMDFANKVTELAEEQQHHPDLHVSYGKVRVEMWTHSLSGISEKDFALASRIAVLQ